MSGLHTISEPALARLLTTIGAAQTIAAGNYDEPNNVIRFPIERDRPPAETKQQAEAESKVSANE